MKTLVIIISTLHHFLFLSQVYLQLGTTFVIYEDSSLLSVYCIIRYLFISASKVWHKFVTCESSPSLVNPLRHYYQYIASHALIITTPDLVVLWTIIDDNVPQFIKRKLHWRLSRIFSNFTEFCFIFSSLAPTQHLSLNNPLNINNWVLCESYHWKIYLLC